MTWGLLVVVAGAALALVIVYGVFVKDMLALDDRYEATRDDYDDGPVVWDDEDDE